MHNLNNKVLIKLLIFIALSTGIIMTIFETVKQFIHSNITVWESHFTTISFTMIVSVVLTYFALRKNYYVMKVLSSLIPICAWCRKVRDEKGNWISFEAYMEKYFDAELTHAVCQECSERVLGKIKAPNKP